jgi:hypothetical protein
MIEPPAAPPSPAPNSDPNPDANPDANPDPSLAPSLAPSPAAVPPPPWALAEDSPARRYQVRRITWASALKVGLATGWVVSLVPALVAAWGVVTALAMVATALAAVQPINLDLFGGTLASFDLLQLLGLSDNAAQLAALAGNALLVFLAVTLALTVLGSLVVVAVLLLFVAAYNLLAGVLGGLEVELATVEATPGA